MTRRVLVPAALVIAAMTLTACPAQPTPSLCRIVGTVDAERLPQATPNPTLPPGVDWSPAHYDIERDDGTIFRSYSHNTAWGPNSRPIAAPIDEATSPDGRYHLWAIAERGAPGGIDNQPIDSNITRFLHIYRLDGTTGTFTEVQRFHAVELFTVTPPENAQTQGTPNYGAFSAVADDGSFDFTLTYDQLARYVPGPEWHGYPWPVLGEKTLRYSNAC